MIEEAETTLEEMTSTAPYRESVWILLASLQHESGQTNVAIETLSDGLRLIPQSAKILYKLSAYCFTCGRNPEGYERLTDALMINFEDHHLLFSDAPFLQQVQAVTDIIDLYKNEK